MLLAWIAVGVLAIFGALMLAKYYKERKTVATGAAATYVADVATGGPGTVCIAPPLATSPVQNCGCPAGAQAAPKSDLFPGSYVAFGYENSSCVDARDRKC